LAAASAEHGAAGCFVLIRTLTYVIDGFKVTYMKETQVYLPKEELDALQSRD